MKGLGEYVVAGNPEDDSTPLWRDILEVLFILFLVLAVLRMLLGAHMPVPIVAVVSCSMIHDDDVIGAISYKFAESVWPMLLESRCRYDAGNNWSNWIREKAPEADIDSFPLKSGFSVGDMILVITPDGGGTILPYFPQTRLGDVVVYVRDKRVSGGEPIIHRVVGIVDVRGAGSTTYPGPLTALRKKTLRTNLYPMS